MHFRITSRLASPAPCNRYGEPAKNVPVRYLYLYLYLRKPRLCQTALTMRVRLAVLRLVGAQNVVVGVAGRGGCVVHGLPWRAGALHG